MDTLLRLVRRSPAAFWALVEEKGLQAEIAKPQAPLRSMSNVVSITAVRAEVGSPDPSYNPREFRRRSFSHGAVPCLQ